MGPGALHEMMALLRFPSHPNVLVGLGKADDAAVYQINASQALVQTVDFFPPIVDDPYDYGYIAAANALSDIYAMGGTPMLALAIAAFPDNLPASITSQILQGGIDAVAAAGAVVAGGHTIVDPEPKYGLCVTGMIDPARVARKSDVHIGDIMVLSKPLGTGIITTAAKRNQVDPQAYAAAVASMKQLNASAAQVAMRHGVVCMTDITGFGLLGHASEMVRDSNVAMQIHASQLPLLPTVRALADAGVAIAVAVDGTDGSHYVVPAAVAGGRWKALLKPTPDSQRAVTFTITASCTSGGCAGATASLKDVVFGDVFFCAGQVRKSLQARPA